MIAQVADEADDIVGHQPADRPRGVGADHHLAVGVEPRNPWMVEPTLGIDERARRCRDGFSVGAVADWEGEAVLGDQFGGRGLPDAGAVAVALHNGALES